MIIKYFVYRKDPCYCRQFYKTKFSFGSYADRPSVLELAKIVLFIFAIINFHGIFVNNASFFTQDVVIIIAWCVYDIIILFHLLALAYSMKNMDKDPDQRRSVGTLWFLVIYTITVGVGYGSFFKLAILFPYHQTFADVTVALIFRIGTCVAALGVLGIVYYYGKKCKCLSTLFVALMVFASQVAFAVFAQLFPECLTYTQMVNVAINANLVWLVIFLEGKYMPMFVLIT